MLLRKASGILLSQPNERIDSRLMTSQAQLRSDCFINLDTQSIILQEYSFHLKLL